MLSKKRIFLIVGLLSLIIFFFFSRSVRTGRWNQTDFDFTVRLQEKIDKSAHLRTADVIGNVMEGSTYLASPGISTAMILLLTFLAAVDFSKKKIRLRALVIPFLFALLVLAEIYGKTVVHHPSPPFFMIKNPSTIFPENYIN